MLNAYEKITALGAKTFIAVASNADRPHPNPPSCVLTGEGLSEAIGTYHLPLPASLHPVLDPLLIIQAFYIFIAQLSIKRGYNPDNPMNLRKITETH